MNPASAAAATLLAVLAPLLAGCGYGAVGALAALVASDSEDTVTQARTGDARLPSLSRVRTPDVPIAVTLAAGTAALAADVLPPGGAPPRPATLKEVRGGTLTAPGRIAVDGAGIVAAPGSAASPVVRDGPLAETVVSFVWDSAADLGGPARGVVFRVTPTGPAGPGRSTLSAPLTVGDSPPLVQIVAPTPSAQVAGNVPILLRLVDEEGDRLDLSVALDVGGRRAPLVLDTGSSSTLTAADARPASEGGALATLVWASAIQIAAPARARILLSVDDRNPATADPSLETTVDVDNSGLVFDARIEAPARVRGAVTPFLVTVGAGTTDLAIEAVTASARPATLLSTSAGVIDGGVPGRVSGIAAATETAISLLWASEADLGGPRAGVVLRARPSVGLVEGRPAETLGITAGDSPPLLVIAAPTSGATVSGETLIELRLVDAESDPLDLALDIEAGGERRPLAPPSGVTPTLTALPAGPIDGPPRVAVVPWDTTRHVASAGEARVIIAAADGNAATLETPVEVTVLVDNTAGIGDATIAVAARVREDEVPAVVTVAAGTAELRVSVATASGGPPLPATLAPGSVAGGTAGAEPGRIEGIAAATPKEVRFRWRAVHDLGGPARDVRLLVEPRGAGGAGVGRTTASGPLTVGDTAPVATFVAPTPSATVGGVAAVQLRLVDPEGDAVGISLAVRRSGGGETPLTLSPTATLGGLPTGPAPGALLAFGWDTAADVPGGGPATLLARLDDGRSATVEAEATLAVTVSNASPPPAPSLTVPARSRSADVPVVVTVAAGTSSLLVQGVTEGAQPFGITFAPDSVAGGVASAGERGRIGGIAASQGPSAVSFVWRSATDLGGPAAGVRIRVVPSGDGGTGAAAVSDAFAVGDSPPVVAIVAPTPTARVGGVVTLALRLFDAESDAVSLTAEVEVDGGPRAPLALAAPTTLTSVPTSPAPGRELSLGWASAQQVAGAGRARIIVTPDDGSAATAEGAVEVTVEVENTLAVGDATVLAPARSRDPDVAFAVTVAAGTSALEIEAATPSASGPATLGSVSGGGASLGAARGRVEGISAPSATALTIVWRSGIDAGGPVAGARLRVTPLGAGEARGRAALSGPITAGDSPPLVRIDAPTSSATVSGLVPVALTLIDAESDPVTLTAEVETAGARAPMARSPATSLAALPAAPASQGGAPATLFWASDQHVALTGTARLLLTPDDGAAGTAESPVEVTVRVDNRGVLPPPSVGVAARVRSDDVPLDVTVAAGTDEVRVEAVLAGGATRAATIISASVGATVTAEPGRVVGIAAGAAPRATRLIWRSSLDLAGAERLGVRVRVTPFTDAAARGAAATTDPVTVGDTAPVVEVLAPADGAEVSGAVLVQVRCADFEGDPPALALTFRAPGATTETPLFLDPPLDLGAVPAPPGGAVLNALWPSAAQVLARTPGVTLTARPDDGNPATFEASDAVVLTVGRDEPPRVRIAAFGAIRDDFGRIGIDLDLSDPEGEAAGVVLQWRLEGEGFPDLPAGLEDPAVRAAVLGSAPARAAHRIMSEAPIAVRGSVPAGGVAADRSGFVDPSVFRRLRPEAVVGARLSLLRAADGARRIATGGAAPGPLAYEDGSDSAGFLEPATGRLLRVHVPSGTLTPVVAEGPDDFGAPVALAGDPANRRLLAADPSHQSGGRLVELILDLPIPSSPPVTVATHVTGVAGCAFAPDRAAVATVATATGAPRDRLLWVPLEPAASTRAARVLALGLDEPGPVVALPGQRSFLVLETSGRRRLLRIELDARGRAPAVVTAFADFDPRDLALEAGAGSAVVALGDEGVARVDLATGNLRVVSLPGETAAHVAASLDGEALLVSSLADGGRLVEVRRAGTALESRTVTAAFGSAPARPPAFIEVGAPFSPLLVTGAAYLLESEVGARTLTAAPSGTRYRFVWDSARDLPKESGRRVFIRATAFGREPGLSQTLADGLLPASFALEAATRFAGSSNAGQPVVRSGDVDGDGRRELIVSEFNGSGHTLRAFRVDPGRLVAVTLSASATTLAVSMQGPSDIAFGDVLGVAGESRARDDLVAAGSVTGSSPATPLVRIYPADGSAAGPFDSSTFTEVTLPAADSELGERDLALDDLDGDGRTDIVLSRPVVLSGVSVGRVVVIWNDGDYTQPQTTKVDVTNTAFSLVATGDVDGDGRGDIVAAGGRIGTVSGSTVAFFNLGGRAFSSPVTVETPEARTGLLVAPISGGGNAIITAREAVPPSVPNALLSAYRANGPGAAQGFTTILRREGGATPRAVWARDLDGDGLTDLFDGRSDPSTTPSVAVSFQTAAGVLAAKSERTLDGIDAITAPDSSYQGGVAEVEDPHGRPLVVVDAGTGGSSVPRGARVVAVGLTAPGEVALRDRIDGGAVRFRHDGSQADFLEAPGQSGIAIADVSDDGRMDVAIAGETDFFPNVYVQDETGRLAADPRAPFADDPIAVVPVDGDGDGRADLLFGRAGGSRLCVDEAGDARLFLSGAGGLALAGGPEAPLFSSETLLAGDLDGDGREEAVIVSRIDDPLGACTDVPGFVAVVPLTAAGIAAPLAVTGAGRLEFDACLADVTGDGRLDVVTCDFERVLIYSERDEAGLLRGPPALLHEVPASGNHPIAGVAAGDLDGDGLDDVAVLLETTAGAPGVLVIRQAAGAPGTYERPEAVAASGTTFEPLGGQRQVGAIAVGDVDGDGRADVVTGTIEGSTDGSGFGARIEVLRQDAAGRLVLWRRIGGLASSLTGLAVHDVAVGDLNGDGVADIAALASTSVFFGDPLAEERLLTFEVRR